MTLPSFSVEQHRAGSEQIRGTDDRGVVALMSCIILAGFVGAVTYHYVVGMYAGRLVGNVTVAAQDGRPPRDYSVIYVGEQYPSTTFLFRPWDMFNDFANLYELFEKPEWLQSQPFRWNHFPFAFLALLPYYYLLPPGLGIVVRELLIFVPFITVSMNQLRGTTRCDTFRNALIFSVCTYPFLFALDRANNEADIFMLVCWFVFLLKGGNATLSTVPLSLALAFKPYPAVFLPLLVIEKTGFDALLDQCRSKGVFPALTALLTSCLHAAAVPVAAFLLNVASIPILANAVSYPVSVLPAAWKQTVDIYVLGDQGVPFSNSLWPVLKIILYQLCGAAHYQQAVLAAMPPYRTTVILAFLAICAYAWICERVFWKRVTLFVCCLNLFPYVSGDYKLLYVFLPIWLFINTSDRDRLDSLYAALFALLLVPKNYARFAAPGMGEANLGVLLNPLIMLTLVTLIMGSGIRRFAQSSRPSPSGSEPSSESPDLGSGVAIN